MVVEIFYIAFCLILAYYNKKRISKDKHINHGYNGAMHIACWVIAGFIFYFTVGLRAWPLLLALPFIGRDFFDASLNLMRFGISGIGYVPLKPRSFVDKIEKSIFGLNGLLPKIIWLIVAISLNILYYR
jgi:hypothetical protein